MGVRVQPEEFRAKPLRVHTLLADAPLHDVTAFHLRGGGQGRRIADFRELFSSDSVQRTNPVLKGLFKLRWALGRLFRWDNEARNTPTSSYVHRLTDADRAQSLDKPGTTEESLGPFRVIYSFDDEALFEIINAIGQHLLHMSIEPSSDGYTAYWAVYVKRVSWLTPLYMALIDPFRRLIVYPAAVRMLERAWARRYG